MTPISQIKSQLQNFMLFREYFTPGHVGREAFLFPYDYVCKQGRSSSLSNINFILTTRCNLNCNVCFQKQELHRKYDELSLDEIGSLIDSVSHEKPFVYLGGGEPLLRKDILQIVRLVKERGLFCSLCTNGLLLNKKTADSLIGSGIDSIIFSLHGAGPIQDKIAGMKGCFRLQMDNLSYLCRKKKNTRVIVNSIVTKENIEHAEELIVALKECGVDSIRFQHRVFLTKGEYAKNRSVMKDFSGSTYTCLQHISDIDPSPYAEKIASLREISKVYFKPELSAREIEEWYKKPIFVTDRRCLFVWRGTFIMPNGDVVPCPFHKLILGNVRQQSLSEIWNNGAYVDFRRLIKKRLLPGCSRCCKL